MHYRVWMSSVQIETISSNLWKTLGGPSPGLALLLYLFTGIIATAIFHILFRKVRNEAGILELIFWGTHLSIIFAWVPWLFASSIVSTVFLFLYGMIGLTGFGLTHRLLAFNGETKSDNQPDTWKMFVNVTKACAAVLAILLGAIATGVLLPWRNTSVEEFELLRYALLCAYVVIGMLIFLIMPLLGRSLIYGPIEDVELEPPGPI